MKIIYQIIIKELLQLKRDKKLFGIVILAPILQLIFLGYAANLDVNSINTIIFDQDNSSTSREFLRQMESSDYFRIAGRIDNYNDISSYIDSRKATLAVILPRDFEKMIRRNETVKIQLILDGSDGNKASIAVGYFQSFTNGQSQKIIADIINKSGMKISSGSISPEPRVWYNPEMKTRVFMVPSIMGLILLIITVALMSMAIVKEREIGTLEQIIVTPIKSWQLILGKLIPYIGVAYVSLGITILITIFWFDIPIKGSVFFLLFASLIYLLSTLGLGLFASTISKTQQQAMMISIFAFNMPMIYLSGFIFPIENMPVIIQFISYLIPLKYYLIIIRGIILKGIGFAELWDQLAVLFLLGVLLLAISTLRFRKRLE